MKKLYFVMLSMLMVTLSANSNSQIRPDDPPKRSYSEIKKEAEAFCGEGNVRYSGTSTTTYSGKHEGTQNHYGGGVKGNAGAETNGITSKVRGEVGGNASFTRDGEKKTNYSTTESTISWECK